MTTDPRSESQLRAEVIELADASLLGELSPADADRLYELICSNPRARQFYLEFISDSVRLQLARGSIERGRLRENVERPEDGQGGSQPREKEQTRRADRWALWPALALSLVLLLAVGVTAYLFLSRPVEQPVVQSPTHSAQPAAKLVSVTDAQWLGSLRPSDDVILPGQRLVLEHGSAEITFSRQARVILQSPADMVIVDGGACRLASGKLTAYVPAPAKGFQVHTPDGTVTDRGTEFGVYVKTGLELEEPSGEQEQPANAGPQQDGKQAPVTEVHVFTGKVELAQTPGHDIPKSQILDPKSQILTAGQAVTISDKKVQPLPAADPFKFALDKLQGNSRHVLLAEDFESYEVDSNVQAIGPWIVQSGSRKGQGIRVADAPDLLSQYKTDAGDPYPNLTPPPPAGSRIVFIACAAHNQPETFPILAREIDGKLLTRNGQVLIEFDILQNSTGPFEPSLALASKVEHTTGIELGRDAEGKKIEWLPYQCYRLRLLLDVMDGKVRGVRADRLHWRGPQGWVHDLTFEPAAKLNWSTPPRYAIFGYPAVSQATPGSIYWLDNVRIEVIAEK